MEGFEVESGGCWGTKRGWCWGPPPQSSTYFLLWAQSSGGLCLGGRDWNCQQDAPPVSQTKESPASRRIRYAMNKHATVYTSNEMLTSSYLVVFVGGVVLEKDDALTVQTPVVPLSLQGLGRMEWQQIYGWILKVGGRTEKEGWAMNQWVKVKAHFKN